MLTIHIHSKEALPGNLFSSRTEKPAQSTYEETLNETLRKQASYLIALISAWNSSLCVPMPTPRAGVNLMQIRSFPFSR